MGNSDLIKMEKNGVTYCSYPCLDARIRGYMIFTPNSIKKICRTNIDMV